MLLARLEPIFVKNVLKPFAISFLSVSMSSFLLYFLERYSFFFFVK